MRLCTRALDLSITTASPPLEEAPLTAVLPAPPTDLMSRRVPLTLLLDIALGPYSAELLAEERVPAQREGS